jgi:hypothetical protein
MLAGNRVNYYSSVQDFTGDLRIECPDCYEDLTEEVEL